MGKRQLTALRGVALVRGLPAPLLLPPRIGFSIRFPWLLRCNQPLPDTQLKRHVLERQIKRLLQDVKMRCAARIDWGTDTKRKLVEHQPRGAVPLHPPPPPPLPLVFF